MHKLHILNISFDCLIFDCFSARIDDKDPGFESDQWNIDSNGSGGQQPLRADRWYKSGANTGSDSDSDHDCSGIRYNLWHRAKSRRLLTHRLSGGDRKGESRGYCAVSWESILHGDVGEYGTYKVLSVLPDKLARYLFEFHAENYARLDLPPLPHNRDSAVIHGLLKAVQVIL